MEILKTTDLKKHYGSGESMVKALDGVSLSVEKENSQPLWEPPEAESQHFCICWEGWTKPTSGSVKVGGELSDMNDEQLTIFRRRQIGFIFQITTWCLSLTYTKILYCPLNWTVIQQINALWALSNAWT